MKITYQIGAGAEMVLADGAYQGPASSSRKTKTELDTNKPIGAATVEYTPRLLRSSDHSFTTKRGFSTLDEADDFFLMHEQDVSGFSGTLRIYSDTDPTTPTHTMANATIQNVNLTPQGVSIKVTYTVKGGVYARYVSE